MKNKLSQEDIESKIAKVEYQQVGKKTTLCLITMKNGFEIIGTSAAVDPNNFDIEVGKPIAYQKALDQVWAFEGYILQNKLNYE